MSNEKTNAIVKVIKYIGAVVGTTLALITLLAFFFAPINADLESLKADSKTMKNKLEQLQIEQLQMKAESSAHSHPEANKTLSEVHDEMIKMQEQLVRASRDIDRIGNRQQTQIDQVANLRAEVSVIANQ